MLPAVDGLLADEAGDLALELGVADLVAVVADRADEEVLAVGEHGGQRRHQVAGEQVLVGGEVLGDRLQRLLEGDPAGGHLPIGDRRRVGSRRASWPPGQAFVGLSSNDVTVATPAAAPVSDDLPGDLGIVRRRHELDRTHDHARQQGLDVGARRAVPRVRLRRSAFAAPEVAGAAAGERRGVAGLLAAGADPAGRPTRPTWSMLEYACHVRDVFRRFDERLGLMLTEDDPLFPNWDQDATAVEARYDEQDPADGRRRAGGRRRAARRPARRPSPATSGHRPGAAATAPVHPGHVRPLPRSTTRCTTSGTSSSGHPRRGGLRSAALDLVDRPPVALGRPARARVPRQRGCRQLPWRRGRAVVDVRRRRPPARPPASRAAGPPRGPGPAGPPAPRPGRRRGPWSPAWRATPLTATWPPLHAVDAADRVL